MPRRSKGSMEAAFQQLKEMFSGATLRAVADIKERGEVLIASVGDSTSDTHDVEQNNRDIWVRFTDLFTGMSELGRLYAPAGILWRLTPKGQGAHVIRARKMRGPGGALVIPDGGDGATNDVVPGWLSKDLSGISLPEGFEIESTGDQIKLVANSGGTSATFVVGKDGTITATSSGNATLTLNKDGSVSVNAAPGKDITFSGNNVNVTAQGNANVTATGNATVQATGTATVSGNSVNVTAQGNAIVQATGTATVAGAAGTVLGEVGLFPVLTAPNAVDFMGIPISLITPTLVRAG